MSIKFFSEKKFISVNFYLFNYNDILNLFNNYMLKKITLSILHSIRKILTIFRNHCLPIKSPSLNSISYEMYKKEEIEKSYNYFKKYFPKSVFILNQYFQEFIINKAKENDPINNKFFFKG